MGFGSFLKKAVGGITGLDGVLNTLDPVRGTTQMLSDAGDPIAGKLNEAIDKNDPLAQEAQAADADAAESLGMGGAAGAHGATATVPDAPYKTGIHHPSGANKIALGTTQSIVTPDQQASAANEYANTWSAAAAPAAPPAATVAAPAAPLASAVAAAPTVAPMQTDAQQYSDAWFGNSLDPSSDTNTTTTDNQRKTIGTPEMGRRLGLV